MTGAAVLEAGFKSELANVGRPHPNLLSAGEGIPSLLFGEGLGRDSGSCNPVLGLHNFADENIQLPVALLAHLGHFVGAIVVSG